MEPYTQGIPPIRTMPSAPIATHRKKKILIIAIIVAILLGAFAAYWFYFRDTSITEQDKLTILDQLKQSSTIDFTPHAKDQILSDLSSQSQSENPAAANLSEDQKLNILNSVGGQK
jgi:hypothetical protein